MQRGLLVLALVVGVGLVTAVVSKRFFQKPPTLWLCREYGLSHKQMDELKEPEKEYAYRCGHLCGEMCKANSDLETLALGSDSITPELRAAVVVTDRIRTETRLEMLDHFYSVAATLPPERRHDYLVKVLPLVIEPCDSPTR